MTKRSMYHSIKKVESTQYDTCLLIAGTISGSSREKHYQEHYFDIHNGLKNCYFYKMYNKKSSGFLFQLIPPLPLPLPKKIINQWKR